MSGHVLSESVQGLQDAAAIKRAALLNGQSNGHSNGACNGHGQSNGHSNGHSNGASNGVSNGRQNGFPSPSRGRSSPALRPAVPPQLQFRPRLSTRKFPRDFSKIPRGTDYGQGRDNELNRRLEDVRITFLEQDLERTLLRVAETKKNIVFTTALIAGDCVIMDVLSRLGLLERIPVIFIDTFHLFPETLEFLREVEEYYGFKAKYYHAADAETQEEFFEKYGREFWQGDIEKYDKVCKVEPLQRALKDYDYDCWINGRRRDMGGLRASLPVWEGAKVNPLAFWTFEDCWSYLRKYEVPYHPLHDVGFSSIGDMHSTKRVPVEKWMTYGGERSGRFQGLTNKDGSAKTECGIHTEIKKDAPSTSAQQQPALQEEKS